ncbi:reverse transcriptase domain-containing protein [Tanacetum coccineum]|uniref:Reverse transcriptase domain-containing protein n=1 Tax=Tanacetum coccineum TaxID=301880 RepID=A0ABQ4WPV3_9ASTR
MNERCSAVLLNKLPLKEKDPGSFTIPCDIGDLHINNALADLGASISLMPYLMYDKLGLGEPKPTRMSLELADRSIQYPRGIAEKVLIKFDKFILLIDFVILDMWEDSKIPIILGRPFLATARAMIDVFNKKITLRIGNKEVIFDVDQSIKKPHTEDDECYGINELDQTIHLEAQGLLKDDQTDSFLLKDLEKHINQTDSKICEEYTNSDKPIRRIEQKDTAYSLSTKTYASGKTRNEHLCSASANEIDEKKPELKDLPSHLEYAYLKGDKTHPIIISSKLTKKEKVSLLQYLFNKHDAKPRLIRWVLPLQGFNIEIKDKKGAENLAADHLSRLENPNMRILTKKEIANEFPDKHLMVLKATPKDNETMVCEYVNYIARKYTTQYGKLKKRKRFFSQVKYYFWDESYAFRLCLDNTMRICVAGNEIPKILAHCHSGPTGGHHSDSRIP